MERIINKPARGIGAKSIEKFQNEARTHHLSMYMAIEKMLAEGAVSGKSKTALSELMKQFGEWRQMLNVLPPDELASQILEDCGYFDMLKNDKSVERRDALKT